MNIKIKISILILLLYLLFYLINKVIMKRQENYLTYFLPFYDVDSNLLNTFYKNHNYNKNYFKQKVDFNIINFGSNNYSQPFNKLISKIITGKTYIQYINSIGYNNNLLLLEDLYKNKINLSISNLLMINYYNKKYTDKLNNFFAIANLYKSYLIIATKIQYNIYSIDKVPYKTKIGILNKNNSMYFYIDIFLKDLNYNKNDLDIIIYDTIQDLYKGFKNNEVKIIIYTESLPSNNLNNLIDYNFDRDIILLPFILEKKLQTKFLIKNSFFKLDTFDLNQIATSYLPKKFSTYFYFEYKPDMPFLTYQHYLITNDKIEYNSIKNITDLFLNNISTINNLLPKQYFIEHSGPRINIARYMRYHPETMKMFEKYGYVTNESNKNCQFLVGVKECNKKTLENNGLDIE